MFFCILCVTANTYLYTECDHLIDTLRELLLVVMTHLKLGFAHLWTTTGYCIV